jgi:hypothetical protein
LPEIGSKARSCTPDLPWRSRGSRDSAVVFRRSRSIANATAPTELRFGGAFFVHALLRVAVSSSRMRIDGVVYRRWRRSVAGMDSSRSRSTSAVDSEVKQTQCPCSRARTPRCLASMVLPSPAGPRSSTVSPGFPKSRVSRQYHTVARLRPRLSIHQVRPSRACRIVRFRGHDELA